MKDKKIENKLMNSYRDIVALIERKVEAGEWSAGRKLPTQRELADVFDVNRSTVIHALDTLKGKGIIESTTGSGTYISSNFSSNLSKNLMNWNDFSKYSVHPTNYDIVRRINNLELDNSLIQLGKGELHQELFPKAAFNKSLRSLENTYDQYGYNNGTGDYRFRQAISTYLNERGISSSPNTILPVSGALQALQLITLGLLQQGSTVYAPYISYIHSLHIFRTSGMRLKSIPFRKQTLNTNHLREDLYRSQNSSVLYINPSFQNPTTITMDLNNREELVELSNEFKMPIIEDDIFRDLWIDQKPLPPIASLDNSGHTLLIGSFSKTMAPTLRIGWISGPADVIEKLSDLRMQLDYGTSFLPQLAVYDFLETGGYDQHLVSLREKLRYRRDMMVDLLEKNIGDYASWEIPKGGMFIWVLFSEDVNVRKLFSSLVERGVLINPGFVYSSYPNQYARFSFTSSSLEEMERGIKIIGEALKHQIT
ncbi:PLP-dependent aminotransferase family protein [Halobacillus sp. Marseille-P3879]|uniref:aminotransferase-like domain-containing protein n=1 Tax=Halobacillus sp. Marseille-P3879 TaxID=2045014 RepID=UPI001357DF75|nr:PLP-dependent aminotransferase family protein [Halobacillus sp. Marseille-P3879]